MAKIIYPFIEKGTLKLSTGTYVDMRTETVGEAKDAFDNLISMMVDEHSEEILKKSTNEGNYDGAMKILHKEVLYLVENELTDHKRALEWILHTLALDKLISILDEMKKQKPDLFQKE